MRDLDEGIVLKIAAADWRPVAAPGTPSMARVRVKAGWLRTACAALPRVLKNARRAAPGRTAKRLDRRKSGFRSAGRCQSEVAVLRRLDARNQIA
ncbi:hypothetical protein [Luteimonas terrae]|uniref:hypothetical protein n=1 Tax=Luteimonas terrae TaxID=1530191 RepID=UPI00140453C2|nr:hypothetical protein [Luteimonas terrae]